MRPNEAVAFRVKVAVPAGTPAQQYGVTGMAYSANAAPEVSSRTSRFTGTWKFDDGSGTGAWDLCTCIS